MAAKYSKSRLEEIIRTYTKAYGALAKQLTDAVLQELNKGKSIAAAVETVFKRNEFHTGNAEAVAEAIYAAALVGLNISPTIVATANEKIIRANLTGRSWTGDGVKLSDRLHGVDNRIKSDIITTVSASMRNYDTVKVMAKKLYDGYNSGKAVISKAQLPEYMSKLRTMMLLAFQGDQVAVNESKIIEKIAAMNVKNIKTPMLKAAYSEVLKACKSQNAKVLEKALSVAAHEKSRYYAERIARTESSRAYYDGFMAKIANDELVIGVMWLLSSSHPKFDICNMYATADMFNMGKGIYPKHKAPKIPVHPHCMCHLLEVYEGEVDLSNTKDNTDKAVNNWLKGLTDKQRRDVLGIKGAEEFDKSGNWQGNLRGLSGFGVPESRLAEVGKNLTVKHLDLVSEISGAKDIDPKVFDIISEVTESFDTAFGNKLFDRAIIGDFVDKSGNMVVFQTDIEAQRKMQVVLKINKAFFEGQTIDEINKRLVNSTLSLANNLQEAVVHEVGHAKLIYGKTRKEIEKLYKELENSGIEDISILAKTDGAETIAEIEVLKYRKISLSNEANLLYNKYIKGGDGK